MFRNRMLKKSEDLLLEGGVGEHMELPLEIVSAAVESADLNLEGHE